MYVSGEPNSTVEVNMNRCESLIAKTDKTKLIIAIIIHSSTPRSTNGMLLVLQRLYAPTRMLFDTTMVNCDHEARITYLYRREYQERSSTLLL